jgi:chaperone BCS1
MIMISSRREEVWSYVDFDHPTTFDTLAMDPAKKKNIMDDLDNFRNNKDYYRRIGKAWKRGYLLYGPPGTGKSTMIAAMANYLNYDVYDIELMTLHNNSDLRKLFTETTGKSIIVIEDIDCSLDLTSKRRPRAKGKAGAKGRGRMDNGLTLSGLLNFIDGLWSANSGEQIIVFTTNYIDELDPALIRRGRMDMHIEMSYCEFEAFKTLAKNYLGVDEHPLFDTIEELLQVVDITPADVAECLMASDRTDRDADACLQRLIDELNAKKDKGKAESSDEDGERSDSSSDDSDDDDSEAGQKRAESTQRSSRFPFMFNFV